MNLLTAASGRVVLLLACEHQRSRFFCVHVPSHTNLRAAGHQPWTPSLYKGVLCSVAQYLRQELNVLGIKISTVTAGPSAPITDASAPIRSEPRCACLPFGTIPRFNSPGSHSVTAGNTLHERSGETRRTTQHYFPSRLGISCCIASIRNTIEEVMPHFAVRHEEVWCVLLRVVRSRWVEPC